MKSIPHPWVTWFLAKRKGLFERFDQLASRIGTASQVASGNNLSSSAGTLRQDRSGNQLNLNITALNAVGRSMIEVDEGRAGVIQNLG